MRTKTRASYDELTHGLEGPQKTIATTLDRTVFVAAGAGSGKTFTLTRRIILALCAGSGEDGKPYLDDIEQALVITFTNKAAGEIKERVRAALFEAGYPEQALKVDNAWISTIHGMCARILRENAFDLGISPDFSMAEEQREALFGQALNRALDEFEDTPELNALFAEYGAGNGKSDEKSSDVTGLVLQYLNFESLTTLGFDALHFAGSSFSATSEISELAQYYEELSTYESSAAGANERVAAGLKQLRSFLACPASEQTVERTHALLDTLSRPTKSDWYKKYSSAEANAAFKELDECYGRIKTACAYAHVGSLQVTLDHLARKVKETYAALKLEAGVMDNDDLLLRCAAAFREHPEIAERYTTKFKLVMIDEFQDTNSQQIAMIKQLSGPDCCHLATVGDAQQAIYGFRGADVRRFNERRAEVGKDSSYEMAINFRSHDEVLRFVKRTCGDTDIVPSFMDLTASDKRKGDAFKGLSYPRVVVEFSRAKGRGKPSADERRRIEAIQIADRLHSMIDKVEPRQMAILMRSTKKAGIYIDALRSRGIESVVVGGSTFKDAPEVQVIKALLYTLANPADTNSGLFPVLESPMFDLDANDMVALGTRKQDTKKVPEDEQGTKENISKEPAFPTKRAINRGIALNAELFEGIEESERLHAAREVLARAWERVGRLDVADIALDVVRESGWLARLEQGGAAERAQAANILRAIDQVRLLSDAQGLDAIGTAREFDSWLATSKQSPATLSGEGANAVSIMTVHASKGLEFDVVVVVGCTGSEKGFSAPKLLSHRVGDEIMLTLEPKTKVSLPKSETLHEPTVASSALDWRAFMDEEARQDSLLEDGRILYVALTRARECVILSLNSYKKADGTLMPQMTQRVADTLGISVLPTGESEFDYGGHTPGMVRVVDINPDEDGSALPDSAHTLDAAIDEFNACMAQAVASESFDVFDVTTSIEAPLTRWRPREGVFSFSSAHKALQKGSGPSKLDDILTLPVPHEPGADAPAHADELPVDVLGEQQARNLVEVPEIELNEDEFASETDDGDRATHLGSAFHELARMMIETGKVPSDERIELVARNYRVAKCDYERLKGALKRWGHSELRAEVLAMPQVRAEVPFFCEVDSPFGRNLEGAIDLLAADDKRALLVDYKTGDHNKTYAQIREDHEMQARFYAYVLALQGYEQIECAFVCVELEESDGQPVVTRYNYS